MIGRTSIAGLLTLRLRQHSSSGPRSFQSWDLWIWRIWRVHIWSGGWVPVGGWQRRGRCWWHHWIRPAHLSQRRPNKRTQEECKNSNSQPQATSEWEEYLIVLKWCCLARFAACKSIAEVDRPWGVGAGDALDANTGMLVFLNDPGSKIKLRDVVCCRSKYNPRILLAHIR